MLCYFFFVGRLSRSVYVDFSVTGDSRDEKVSTISWLRGEDAIGLLLQDDMIRQYFRL